MLGTRTLPIQIGSLRLRRSSAEKYVDDEDEDARDSTFYWLQLFMTAVAVSHRASRARQTGLNTARSFGNLARLPRLVEACKMH